MPNASSTLSITLKKAKALTPNLVSAFLLPDNNKCGIKMKYGAKYKNRANLWRTDRLLQENLRCLR